LLIFFLQSLALSFKFSLLIFRPSDPQGKSVVFPHELVGLLPFRRLIIADIFFGGLGFSEIGLEFFSELGLSNLCLLGHLELLLDFGELFLKFHIGLLSLMKLGCQVGNVFVVGLRRAGHVGQTLGFLDALPNRLEARVSFSARALLAVRTHKTNVLYSTRPPNHSPHLPQLTPALHGEGGEEAEFEVATELGIVIIAMQSSKEARDRIRNELRSQEHEQHFSERRTLMIPLHP
jgi:hypothetical protein